MPNLELEPKQQLSSFRRIAIGTWRNAYDPSVYGSLTLRMDEAMRYIDEFRKRTGNRLTVTHLMAKATAAALQEMPDANAILRFNRPYLRKTIGIFFQVAMEDEETGEIDLSGATIHDADKKSLPQIVDEFQKQVQKVRKKKDEQLERTRSTFKKIPFVLLNFVLRVIGFLTYTLNLDLRKLGLPKDPFGSAMVTNIGTLGLDEAYVPLVPYSRVPLLLAVGAVRETPIVEDGEVKIGKTMRVHATFDHRLLDGTHAAVMSKVLRAWFERPFEHFDADPPEQAPAPSTGKEAAPAPKSSSTKRRMTILAVVALALAALGTWTWTQEMREIRLCSAIKDFYAANHRPPVSLAELPADVQHLTTAPDGTAYQYSCSGTPPQCSVSWSEDGNSFARSTGPLDERSLADWF